MSDSSPGQPLGALHAATRLGRIQQQLVSFARLHRAEIEGVLPQLQAAGLTELAARLTTYQELHAGELDMVIDELADLAADFAAPQPTVQGTPGLPEPTTTDPAENSPRRAAWLTEQANRSGAKPLTRRDFLLPGSGGE